MYIENLLPAVWVDPNQTVNHNAWINVFMDTIQANMDG